MAGVAHRTKKFDYSTDFYLNFYHSLLYLSDFEKRLYDDLSVEEKEMLP